MVTVGELKKICEMIEKEYGSDCPVIVQIKSNSPSVNGIIGEYAVCTGHNGDGALYIRSF